MSVLDGEPAMRVGSMRVMIVRGSLPKLQQVHLYDEGRTKTPETTRLKHTECHSRGSEQRVQTTA